MTSVRCLSPTSCGSGNCLCRYRRSPDEGPQAMCQAWRKARISERPCDLLHTHSRYQALDDGRCFGFDNPPILGQSFVLRSQLLFARQRTLVWVLQPEGVYQGSRCLRHSPRLICQKIGAIYRHGIFGRRSELCACCRLCGDRLGGGFHRFDAFNGSVATKHCAAQEVDRGVGDRLGWRHLVNAFCCNAWDPDANPVLL